MIKYGGKIGTAANQQPLYFGSFCISIVYTAGIITGGREKSVQLMIRRLLQLAQERRAREMTEFFRLEI